MVNATTPTTEEQASCANEVHLLEFLRSLERATKKTGRMQLRLFQRGRVFSKHGLLNACSLHGSNVGNRHVHRLSMSDFLEASYGPSHSVLKALQKKSLMTASGVAVSMQVSVPYVQLMGTVTAGAYAFKQIHTLARVLALCPAEQPDCVGLRMCWDETQQWTTANFGKGPDSGAFQICVLKTMLVGIPNAQAASGAATIAGADPFFAAAAVGDGQPPQLACGAEVVAGNSGFSQGWAEASVIWGEVNEE